MKTNFNLSQKLDAVHDNQRHWRCIGTADQHHFTPCCSTSAIPAANERRIAAGDPPLKVRDQLVTAARAQRNGTAGKQAERIGVARLLLDLYLTACLVVS